MLVIFLILTSFLCIDSERTSIDEAPSITLSHNVQFFYLSAPFPYNAPANIVKASGTAYQSYGIAHGGIGVWDTDDNIRFSIELVADNYVGSLLPGFDTEDRTLQWNNTASIVVTNPIDTDVWLYSNLVVTTQGSAYKQLLNYLQDGSNTKDFDLYQPVAAIFLNLSTFNESDILSYDSAYFSDNDNILVTRTDSYSFADEVLKKLNDYGCRLRDFLPVYSTSFDYVNADKQPAATVSWLVGEETNRDVYDWYMDLNSCYESVLNATMLAEASSSSDYTGIELFFSGAKYCYGPYAYIYRSPTSVWNVTLAYNTTAAQNGLAGSITPVLSRFEYILPNDNSSSHETLSAGDIAVLVGIVFVAVVLLLYFFINKLLKKKKRRRISFEMERIAARTVDGLVKQSEQSDNEQAREDIAYYHGSARKQSKLTDWTARFSSHFGGGPASRGGGRTANQIRYDPDNTLNHRKDSNSHLSNLPNAGLSTTSDARGEALRASLVADAAIVS